MLAGSKGRLRCWTGRTADRSRPQKSCGRSAMELRPEPAASRRGRRANRSGGVWRRTSGRRREERCIMRTANARLGVGYCPTRDRCAVASLGGARSGGPSISTRWKELLRPVSAVHLSRRFAHGRGVQCRRWGRAWMQRYCIIARDATARAGYKASHATRSTFGRRYPRPHGPRRPDDHGSHRQVRFSAGPGSGCVAEYVDPLVGRKRQVCPYEHDRAED